MKHIPVLKDEVMSTFSYLRERKGHFIDGTLGLGGHSLLIAKELFESRAPNIIFVGIDKDFTALALSKLEVEKSGLLDRFVFFNDDHANISTILAELGIRKIQGALLDLGVSSLQLDNIERGFSFKDKSAPIDMRMNQNQNKSAKDIVNNYSESDLTRIFKDLGEERYSRKVAHTICRTRKQKPLKTIGDLLGAIKLSIPGFEIARRKTHFATDIFRALRIETNEELANLSGSLNNFVEVLDKGARLAVITFHSQEDRIAKNLFKRLSRGCVCPEKAPVCVCGHAPTVKIINKKPIIPNELEIKENTRSRSAKLRVVEKI